MNAPENSSENAFIDAVLAGDSAAFEPLVRRHEARLRSFCLALLGNETDAEDAAQEVFLKAFRSLSRFRQDSQFYTWLHRIAHNLAVDRLRARGRWQPAGEEDDDVQPISAPQPRELETKRRVETLEAAWAELPERQAAALGLVHIDGLSGSEAASVLGVSEDALESLLARGRRALKAELRRRDLLTGAVR